MTKLQIMFFLQTFIIRRKYDFSRSVIDTFEFDVENILKSCYDYEDFLRKLTVGYFVHSRCLSSLAHDFAGYLRAIEIICS